MSIRKEERELSKLKEKNGGAPIGCLAEKSASGMFDAVFPNFTTCPTFGKPEKIKKGTRVKLWNGEIVTVP